MPYVVQGAERFFERAEVRQAMVALRAADPLHPGRDAAAGGRGRGARPRSAGRRDAPPAGGAARERWEALAALVQLAEEYAATPEVVPIGEAASVERPVTLTDFTEELARRAAQQHAPTVDGVTLASLHSAKGLEWDAVFLVGLAEGTLPTTYAKTAEQVEEERRLLYVGMTRARQWLWLSYAAARSPGGRARRPSPVPAPAGPLRRRRAGRRPAPARRAATERRRTAGRLLPDLRRHPARRRRTASWAAARPARPTSTRSCYERLREWRQRVAGAQKVPAYVVFTDATLTALAERRPGRPEELLAIAGIGPRKLGLYGDAVLALVGGASGGRRLPGENFRNLAVNSFALAPGRGIASGHTSRAAPFRLLTGVSPVDTSEREGGGPMEIYTYERPAALPVCPALRCRLSGWPSLAAATVGSAGAPGPGSGRADPDRRAARGVDGTSGFTGMGINGAKKRTDVRGVPPRGRPV